MRNTFSPKNAGFTLVESMVAVSILSVAITGPLLIAQKGIASAVYSRDQVTASYLAQEAVEYIRNARDTNGNNGSSWLNGFDACVSPNFCVIDARYPDFTTVDGSGLPLAVKGCTGVGGICPNISLNKSTSGIGAGLYGYESSANGFTTTPFVRAVSLVMVGGGQDQAILTVRVSWTTALFTPVKQFVVKEVLFNI
ncbi:MAG: prepilin-type N-terminal cleavage/methylation domain-containing protein [Candidatus Paceibacterota bacterium]|jgi:prepilin-type N-terminal cleavage/methylation domain-containing protein